MMQKPQFNPTMSLTIVSYPGSVNTAKGLIAAQYGGVTVNEDPEFQMGVTNKSKAFKALNPNMKVPTLVIEEEDGSKKAVWESNAIARYICSVGNDAGQALLGEDAYSQAMVSAWCDWAQVCRHLVVCARVWDVCWGVGLVAAVVVGTSMCRKKKRIASIPTHRVSHPIRSVPSLPPRLSSRSRLRPGLARSTGGCRTRRPARRRPRRT